MCIYIHTHNTHIRPDLTDRCLDYAAGNAVHYLSLRATTHLFLQRDCARDADGKRRTLACQRSRRRCLPCAFYSCRSRGRVPLASNCE